MESTDYIIDQAVDVTSRYDDKYPRFIRVTLYYTVHQQITGKMVTVYIDPADDRRINHYGGLSFQRRRDFKNQGNNIATAMRVIRKHLNRNKVLDFISDSDNAILRQDIYQRIENAKQDLTSNFHQYFKLF